MRTPFRFAALALPVLLIAACGDTNEPDEDTGVDVSQDVIADVEDAGADVSTDVDTDTPDSDTDTPDADVDVEEDVTVTSCTEQADCDEGFLCVDSVCESLFCANPSDWVKCQNLFNRVEADSGRYATCWEQECRVACFLDDDCGEGELCTDFGFCRPFTGDMTVEYPREAATGTLQAGVANVLMNFPVGTPQGGYGERAAVNDGRYAESLRATAGQMHGLYARAVVIDNGDRQMLFIRLPTIFTQAGLHEAVARALQERTGDDWRHSIIISSTHTHSGPCRHWHLPGAAAAPLGAFGIGEFSQMFFELLRDTVIEAANAALDDLAPAKIGWEIVEAFDVDDQVGSDRWDQTPPFDDNRLLMIRVDDMDDVPRAVMVSYAAHGTMNEVEYMSGDGVGRAERTFEEALGEEFERFVPVLFMNQNSGTIGPAGGSQGHAFPMSMERLGYALVTKTWEEFLEMETTTELTLRSRTMRFPLSYDLMGYERGAFGSTVPPPFGGEYHFGGLSCVGTSSGDQDIETHAELDNIACAGALQFLLYNAPPTTMVRSQMTMMEMNGLTIGTVPGELAMELSWEMLRALRDQFGVDPLAAWTFGYANDHIFYLLPTNLRGDDPPFPGQSTPQPIDDYPDFAFSYLQGGYESTMSMWGPALGDYLVERFAETYALMDDAEFVPAQPQPLPTEYSVVDEEPFGVDSTSDDVAGTWTIQVPDTVERLETIEFAWMGGDPGAEQPQMPVVTLEIDNDGYETVMLPNYHPYSNLEWRFLTRVRQAADSDDYEWVVRWEEISDFPDGRYRFRINGHYLSEESGERTPYELVSEPFELLPTDDIIITADATETALSGTLGFPADERGRFRGPAVDPGAATGNFRMRHPMVPTGTPGPVEDIVDSEVEIALYAGESLVTTGTAVVTTAPESAGGRSNVPVTRFTGTWDTTVSPGTYTLEIDVTDVHGNTGTLSQEVTF